MMTVDSILFSKDEVCSLADMNNVDCDKLYSYLDNIERF